MEPSTAYDNYHLVKFNGKQLHVILCEDKPWFCGEDVCAILGFEPYGQKLLADIAEKHKISHKELATRLAPEIIQENPVFISERGCYSRMDAGPETRNDEDSREQVIYISELGLYKLAHIFEHLTAIVFYEWIIEELLPSIRIPKIRQLMQELEQQKQLVEKKETELVFRRQFNCSIDGPSWKPDKRRLTARKKDDSDAPKVVPVTTR